MDDKHGFGWSTVKGAHIVLLCRIKEGCVSCSDTHKIDGFRRGHVEKKFKKYTLTLKDCRNAAENKKN